MCLDWREFLNHSSKSLSINHIFQTERIYFEFDLDAFWVKRASDSGCESKAVKLEWDGAGDKATKQAPCWTKTKPQLKSVVCFQVSLTLLLSSDSVYAPCHPGQKLPTLTEDLR